MVTANGTRILITGMSGTGKSTLVGALVDLGHRAADLDEPGWSRYVDPDPELLRGSGVDAPASGREWVWREDRVRRLLEVEQDGMLFVGGCAPNQGRFYPLFDRIVLLTAPVPVTVERLAKRTTNPYGKRPGEVAEVLANKQTVEPLLQRGATLEIDTGVPIHEVVRAVLDHAAT